MLKGKLEENPGKQGKTLWIGWGPRCSLYGFSAHNGLILAALLHRVWLCLIQDGQKPRLRKESIVSGFSPQSEVGGNAAGASGPKHINTKFAQLVKDILQRAVALTRRARQHAGLKPGDLPWVQRLIYLPDFG